MVLLATTTTTASPTEGPLVRSLSSGPRVCGPRRLILSPGSPMSLPHDKGCIQCAACLPTFLACCWPCPARSSVSSSCHAPHHNATRAVLFRTLRGLRLRRARIGEQLRPPGRERSRSRLGQCRLAHDDLTLNVYLVRSFDASQAWSPRFRMRWQSTRVQSNVRADTPTF